LRMKLVVSLKFTSDVVDKFVDYYNDY